jgi:YidC/Oxa1 family membrane protein insertase
VFLYDIVPGNDLGLAIILLTVIIKIILYPLSKKSIKSQKALQELQPKMEEIKKKYKDNREAQSKALLQLYKENQVNPLSSCLPLLIQLPFLFAVFRVFRDGLANGALDLVYPFIARPETIDYISLGIVDLSQRNIPIALMAGAAQFWQTKMLSAKKPPVKSPGAKDESMMAMMNKQMTYMMPVLTVIIGLQFPGGLALYWLTTTVLTALQQLIMFKKKPLAQETAGSGNNKKNKNPKTIEGEVVKK